MITKYFIESVYLFSLGLMKLRSKKDLNPTRDQSSFTSICILKVLKRIHLFMLNLQTKIQAAHKAVEKADLKYVKLLIDRKKMSLCRDSRRLTPLHKAIIFGHIKIIKYLVRYYPQAINAMDEVLFSSIF